MPTKTGAARLLYHLGGLLAFDVASERRLPDSPRLRACEKKEKPSGPWWSFPTRLSGSGTKRRRVRFLVRVLVVGPSVTSVGAARWFHAPTSRKSGRSSGDCFKRVLRIW